MLNLDSLKQLKQLKADLKSSKSVFEGIVIGTSGRYGFVEDDQQKTHFLCPDEMSKVLPGDKVEFSLTSDLEGKEQAVIERLKQSDWSKLVGRFVQKGKAQFLETDMPSLSRTFYIPPGDEADARVGDFVECVLNRHPFPSGKPRASVCKIISSAEAQDFRQRLTLARFDLSDEWPLAVQDELQKLSEQDIERLSLTRTDLTELDFVTIDSASTQDMDDALYVEEQGEGWCLYVAIADPSALVPLGSEIDKEARRRLTSLYLPGMMVPMLPEYLTQSLCSIRPKVSRLAWVMSFKVSKLGELSEPKFQRAVIQSKAKLSYHEVAEVLNSTEPSTQLQDKIIGPLLLALNACAQALRAERQQTALVMDERPDYSIQLDSELQVVGIEVQNRNEAHKMVEDCMLAANRSFATWLKTRVSKGLFNTQPGFRTERWSEVKALLKKTFNKEALKALNLTENLPDLAGFKLLMRHVDQANLDWPLKAVLLRCFERGQLKQEALPHMAMGLEVYSTLTSPIRKYSDLTNHRLLALLVEGSGSEHATEESSKDETESKATSSSLELDAAVNALVESELLEDIQSAVLQTRKASGWLEKWYHCEFMQKQSKGTVFAGEVSQVFPAGLMVRLAETGIEGFVDLKRHDETFRFDALRLTQESESCFYALETKVNVDLKRINWIRRTLEFNLKIEYNTKG